ncbi:hypothetical protein QTA58_22660 [Neorhizobium sp. CSC1952]|uniref:hypothetical protein n=1 Tax=Neorhizobium sp. CSC1952 TaxID=2978974 RepID=UPI0025A67FD2|nr:hypothetical protein [Rhizobium sp. CSC1952]WJR66957.1 hypothetical protein QTA58_22660 [Rhizobium sp. CSC1952]
MKISYSAPAVLTGLLLSACTTPIQTAKPSDITVRAAVIEVADALYEVQQRAANRPKAGMIADEAIIEFNVAAKSTNKATASADAKSIPLGVGGTLGLAVSNEAYTEGSRGNTIKITFKNLATADYSKGGKEMADRCLVQNPPPGCPKVWYQYPAN